MKTYKVIQAHVNGHKLYVTISIGASVYPENVCEGKSLLRKADITMYNAKENCKSNFCYFNEYVSKSLNLRRDIRKTLRNALENKELYLCYQPLIDIKTKRMVSVEALIRWRHPGIGMISPLEFIPVAEETGFILPMGEWVLQNACRQLKQWHEMGYTSYSLSVNVSAVQLQQPDFSEVVSSILEEVGLMPDLLQLEITESVFINSIHIVTKNLNRLRKTGIRVSIDDFGTGYCCLEYLQKLVINSLKIDRKFVCDIKMGVNRAIIDTVISLGHRLDVEITAEGVETKEQYEYLESKGCDRVQGYYFSKPLLPQEMTELLKAEKNMDRNFYT